MKFNEQTYLIYNVLADTFLHLIQIYNPYAADWLFILPQFFGTY